MLFNLLLRETRQTRVSNEQKSKRQKDWRRSEIPKRHGGRVITIQNCQIRKMTKHVTC